MSNIKMNHQRAKTLNPFLWVAAVLVVLCLSSAAFAQDGPALAVEINKGKLIRLSTPASAVMVADPAIADVQVVSPTLVYLNGKAVGETTVFAVDSKDNEVLNKVITVTHNLSKLERTVKSLMPDAAVKFRSMDNALVMDGNANSPMEVESIRKLAAPFLQANQTLINMVKSNGSDQVTLMVKIAEVQRSQLKRFGIHLESVLNRGSFVYGLAQGRDVVDAAGTFTRNGTDSSIGIGHNTNSGSVNGVLDALEDQGIVSVLAEPNLTAISGQPASFLAGGEFPIPVVGQDGQVTVEYRPYGVSLAFTPTILSHDKISLTVTPEVSSLSQVGSVQTSGFNIPSVTTRRANTTVEIGSGQSFAIAGLLQNDRSNNISKFPALGDLPIIGALFRSNQFQNDQTELVIIVTPVIVSPVNTQEALSDPVEGIEMPNDLERVLLGKLYREQGKDDTDLANAEPSAGPGASSSAPRLHGKAGYILK